MIRLAMALASYLAAAVAGAAAMAWWLGEPIRYDPDARVFFEPGRWSPSSRLGPTQSSGWQ